MQLEVSSRFIPWTSAGGLKGELGTNPVNGDHASATAAGELIFSSRAGQKGFAQTWLIR